jgi:REP element-mobilizing transposase RayT
MKEKDIKSLEHTTWRCQYHIVFAPKYRRMEIYGELEKDIGWILRKLSDEKGVEIVQAEACPDHVHMLVSIPPKYSVSSSMGFLTHSLNLVPKLSRNERKTIIIQSFLLSDGNSESSPPPACLGPLRSDLYIRS